MSKNKEIEVRAMLDEDKYYELCSSYLRKAPYLPFLNILNIYYDTSDFTLYHSHSVLRLRLINNTPTFTLKKGLDENTAMEINQVLSGKQYNDLVQKNIFPHGKVENEIKSYGQMIHKYHEIGKLRTKRLEIKEDDVLIAIDANTFNDEKDYNIEIEASNLKIAKEKIEQLSKQFNFHLSSDYQTKYHRFMNKISND